MILLVKYLRLWNNGIMGDWERLKRHFFALAKPQDEIDKKSDKRNRCDQPPQRFFAGRAEIFLGHIHDGPDGRQKKRNAQPQENGGCFQRHD